MSTNIPTFVIPHHEENVRKLESLAKKRQDRLDSGFQRKTEYLVSILFFASFPLAFVGVLSLIFGEKYFESDGINISTALASFFIALFLLSIYLMLYVFKDGGPYTRKIKKASRPLIEDLSEKLKHWLKLNYGLSVDEWRLQETTENLFISSLSTPSDLVDVNLIQDKKVFPLMTFDGNFVEKTLGVFELQKASINDTAESIYFTPIPETEREKLTR